MLTMNIKLIYFFINDVPDQKFKVGMACIDIFSKYAVVVAIKSKKEGDVAAGILECLNKMNNNPQIIYNDDEGALKTEAMQKYFKEKILLILSQEPMLTLLTDI